MSLVLVPLAILWPAALLAAVADGRRRAVGLAAAGALVAATAALVALAVATLDGDVLDVVAGDWPADVGIRLRVDALGAVFAVTSAIVLLAALVLGVLSDLSARAFPALVLLLGVGLTGLFSTGDVFSFYVFFELAMIASYSLAAVGGEGRQVGGALIFAVVNLLGTFLFLIAVAGVYRVTGTLEMEAVAARLTTVDPTATVTIAVTFFVAFSIKLGLFPFHFWLPAVYASAPPAVAAVLAGALANIGGYGLLRFGADLLPRELELADTALVLIGAGSILYGTMQAVSRRDTREVLAYSSVGQAGFILVAIGIGGPIGYAAAVVFAVTNALTKALLFLAADLRGPVSTAAFAIGALSTAGIPPTAGFFGKAALFEAGVAAEAVAVVVLLFAGSALSFVYMFQSFQQEYWAPEGFRPAGPPRLRVALGALALVVLAVGLWPEPLLALGEEAGALLAEPPR